MIPVIPRCSAGKKQRKVGIKSWNHKQPLSKILEWEEGQF